MRIHILTAVTRPENLARVQESIYASEDRVSGVETIGHRKYDIARQHVGGQYLKNRMLDEISEGWVCILDDDTVMHHKFLRRVHRTLVDNRDAQAIVVSQKRTTGVVLEAKRENMVVGKVDAGQALIRRSLIGDLRIPETYAGDGEWLECLLLHEPDVVFVPEVLSLHNVLSGVDVSETPERMGA